MWLSSPLSFRTGYTLPHLGVGDCDIFLVNPEIWCELPLT